MIKKISSAVLLVVLILLFHLLIDRFALSSIGKMLIVAESDQESQITVYYSAGVLGKRFSEKQAIRSQTLNSHQQTKIVLDFKNRLGRNLRIDPFAGEGSLKIYYIKLVSFFGDTVFYHPSDIAEQFQHDASTTLLVANEYVEIFSNGPDPQLELKKPLRFNNALLGYLLPMFLGSTCFIVLRSISLKDIPAIQDIYHKNPSTHSNIIALDGLRGFAAILVLADHANFPFCKGLGSLGVWIFFSLSGFLLSIPFVKTPGLIRSPSYLQQYFLRRVKRILPMYYFVLAATYLLRGHVEYFIRHALFIQGDGIFWSVPQEMFFYLILPLIFLVNFYICNGRVMCMILLTFTFALLCNQYFDTSVFYLYGNGRKLPWLIGIFLSGVSLSYFYHSPHIRFLRNFPAKSLNIIGIVVFSSVLLSSDTSLDYLFGKNINYTWVYTGQFGALAVLLLLFTVISNNSILHTIMATTPLRAVGIVGFSFYLLHPNALHMLKISSLHITGQTLTGVPLFILAAGVTYLLSLITYSLIERPFLRNNIIKNSTL